MELLAAAAAGGAFAFGGLSLGVLHQVRQPAPKVKQSAIVAVGHKSVTLPDGRILEYAVGGDPGGHAVYYQHGYAASCMLPPSWDAAARSCGIKLIAASMPGFGLSDSYPLGRERTLSEWPADVLAVLRQEKVTRAHFFGISAGCVHVAALVKALPREMVGNVCLSTPTCPDDVAGSHEGMSKLTLTAKKLMGKPYIGDLGAFALSRMRSMWRVGVAPDVRTSLRRMRQEMPVLFDELIATLDHGVSFTYRGLTDNAGTIMKPIPFSLDELGALTDAGSAIAITSSDDDTTNPPSMQRWFRGQIPGSRIMKFGEGWGHLHAFPPANFQRILRFLVTGSDSGEELGEPPSSLRAAPQPHSIGYGAFGTDAV